MNDPSQSEIQAEMDVNQLLNEKDEQMASMVKEIVSLLIENNRMKKELENLNKKAKNEERVVKIGQEKLKEVKLCLTQLKSKITTVKTTLAELRKHVDNMTEQCNEDQSHLMAKQQVIALCIKEALAKNEDLNAESQS